MNRQISLFLALFCFVLVAAQQDSDTTKKVRWAGIPVVNYNPSFGFTYGAMGMAFYKLNAKDTISPSSSTGAFIGATTNDSWFGVAFQQLYLKEDGFRVSMAYGAASINFQTFVDPGIWDGIFVDYNTVAQFAFVEAQRRVVKDLYAGASFAYIEAKTEFDILGNPIPMEKKLLNNIGLAFSYDTRDEVNYPIKGMFLNFKPRFYADWLSSDHEYQLLDLNYTHFFSVSNNKILLARAKANIATGDVPFEGQSIVGRDDIRGYTKGKYRGNQVYAIQSEMRWNFYKRWGMVGFLGFGTALDDFSDFSLDQVLPGIGTGIRFQMIESEQINVGIDVAVGKDDWGLYFRIGEAFSR